MNHQWRPELHGRRVWQALHVKTFFCTTLGIYIQGGNRQLARTKINMPTFSCVWREQKNQNGVRAEGSSSEKAHRSGRALAHSFKINLQFMFCKRKKNGQTTIQLFFLILSDSDTLPIFSTWLEIETACWVATLTLQHWLSDRDISRSAPQQRRQTALLASPANNYTTFARFRAINHQYQIWWRVQHFWSASTFKFKQVSSCSQLLSKLGPSGLGSWLRMRKSPVGLGPRSKPEIFRMRLAGLQGTDFFVHHTNERIFLTKAWKLFAVKNPWKRPG